MMAEVVRAAVILRGPHAALNAFTCFGYDITPLPTLRDPLVEANVHVIAKLTRADSIVVRAAHDVVWFEHNRLAVAAAMCFQQLKRALQVGGRFQTSRRPARLHEFFVAGGVVRLFGRRPGIHAPVVTPDNDGRMLLPIHC